MGTLKILVKKKSSILEHSEEKKQIDQSKLESLNKMVNLLQDISQNISNPQLQSQVEQFPPQVRVIGETQSKEFIPSINIKETSDSIEPIIKKQSKKDLSKILDKFDKMET